MARGAHRSEAERPSVDPKAGPEQVSVAILFALGAIGCGLMLLFGPPGMRENIPERGIAGALHMPGWLLLTLGMILMGATSVMTFMSWLRQRK
jgi:hypothetical protein